MTSGAVWKVILRFAFPLLIGNLLQQLYNVTDSVIVGQFLGKESLAAVSASFFIYYFIISLKSKEVRMMIVTSFPTCSRIFLAVAIPSISGIFQSRITAK